MPPTRMTPGTIITRTSPLRMRVMTHMVSAAPSLGPFALRSKPSGKHGSHRASRTIKM